MVYSLSFTVLKFDTAKQLKTKNYKRQTEHTWPFYRNNFSNHPQRRQGRTKR